MKEAGQAVTSVGRRRWWALAALAVAMLTIGLDTTILNVAIPTLSTALHASNDELQWFSAVYTLVLAVVLLPAGALGDRFGRKRLLLGAMVVFGVASAACAWASTGGMLIGARAVLGLGAAFMMPLSMAVLPTLFPDSKERARAITVWVSSTALGLPLGPILGGWLLDHFWWGSVFLINLPLILVGLLAVALLVPETSGRSVARIDVLGVVLSSAGLLSLTYGCIHAGTAGWADATTLLLIAAGVALLAGFLRWQRRPSHPLIRLELFRHRGFSFGSALAVLASFALMGLIFVLPQYFQAVQGQDALGTGVRLLPMIGGLMVGSRLGGRWVDRVGARGALITGCLLLTLSMGAGALTGAGTPYGLSSIWIAGVGIGLGLTLPTAMSIATDALQADTAGSGSALLQALRQVGGTIGVALLGTVLSAVYRGRLALGGVPEAVATQARSNVSAGVAAAARPGSGLSLDGVRDSFVHGMDAVLLVCAGMTLLGAVLAFWYRADPPAGAVADAAPLADGTNGAAQSLHERIG